MSYKITTIEAEERLAQYFDYRQNIIVPNVSWGFHLHECDLLVLRKSGYLVEIEIKVTRTDLKKDRGKFHKHIDDYNRVKELWFAIPDYLQDSIEFIPEHAGVIVLNKEDRSYSDCPVIRCKILRKARINKSARTLYENEMLKLARLGTMRIWTLKKKIINGKKHVKIVQDRAQLKLF